MSATAGFHLPAKLTRPRPAPGTVSRARLFRELENDPAQVIWVVGPPGAGKTTLVTSFAQQAKLSCLWYEIDTGDADAATFFHYMGLAARHAAPQMSIPLPHLTPEYLPSLPQFTRRYFEQLCVCLTLPAVLVFDNYQEAGEETALHALMAQAFAVLPAGVRVIVMSRAEPPSAFARLRAGRVLSLLEWDAIRLTAEESCAVALARNPGLSATILEQLHAQTEGWAAGLVLALERERGAAVDGRELKTPQAVFDYFAEEIFARMDGEAQAILLRCAFLPRVSAAQAEALTGDAAAGALFARLNGRGYFTFQDANAEYQLHPLFRQFLLARAVRCHDAETVAAIRCGAAGLLAAAGEIGEAVPLYLEAQAWPAVAALIERHAAGLLVQGRATTLETWLRALPAAFLDAEPWLLYWSGMCRLSFDPVAARERFEQSFELFTRRDESAGLFLAWAAVVDTFVYEWGDFTPLDGWIETMDALLARQPLFPSREVAARVSSGMFAALAWRSPQREETAAWAERVKAVVVESDDIPLKMSLGNNLVLYYLWMGNFAEAGVVVDALRPAALARDNQPLTQLHWWVMLAMYSWFVADHEGCLAAIGEGERLAEASGVHLLDLFLLAQGVYSGVSQADEPAACRLLQKMALINSPRLMDKSLYHYQASAWHWQRGDLARSLQHGRTAVELALGTHSPLPVALTRVELAVTLFEAGERTAAREELARGAAAGRGMKLIEFMAFLHAARFALEEGDISGAVAALRQAFARGNREGYVNTPRWNPQAISRLCALALEHDVEPDYARSLIRRRGLVPSGSLIGCETWPWPLKVFTCGAFAVVKEGKPLGFAGKAQRKPVELLQALVAFGGSEVPVRKLADTLWPDDVDAPVRALYTALHRLRTWLGDEQAVILAGNNLSLNRERVWSDVWALEADLSQAETQLGQAEDHDLLPLLERALRHCRGPFLPEVEAQPWPLALRERLDARSQRLIEWVGARAEARGDWAGAIACYERGLGLNDLSEELYRRLMACQARLGRRAEVAATFRRCADRLAGRLGIAPDPRTEAAREAALAASDQLAS